MVRAEVGVASLSQSQGRRRVSGSEPRPTSRTLGKIWGRRRWPEVNQSGGGRSRGESARRRSHSRQPIKGFVSGWRRLLCSVGREEFHHSCNPTGQMGLLGPLGE
ncbi:unnamed protein product [Linum trigynum]|uniref:Uncharacterized protein n=1 Tax=Linum trigynum TaxID=586398 RepID=A0AAV2GS68_9ROSI